jgi:hypothetical protein
MPTQIALLREQLARQVAQNGAAAPQVEHLRWQIVSLERQARWREQSGGMFGASQRTVDPEPMGGLG